MTRVLATLFGLMRPRQRLVFFGLICALFVGGLLEMTGMVALFGYVRGLAASDGLRHGPLADLLTGLFGPLEQLPYVLAGGTVVLLILLSKNVVSSLAHFGLNRFFGKLNQRVTAQLFDGYLMARLDVFGRRGVSEPAGNVNQVFEVFGSCFTAVSQVLADGAIVLCVAVLLLLVDPGMTLVGLVTFGLAGTTLYLMTQRALGQLGDAEAEARKLSSQYLREGFFGLIDGRLNHTRDEFVDNYRHALARTAMVKRRRALMARLPQTTNEILLALTIVAAVIYITLRGQGVSDSLPTLTIFAFAGLRLTAAFSRISKSIQLIRQKSGPFASLDEIIRDVSPEVLHLEAPASLRTRYTADEQPHDPIQGRLRSQLRVRDLSFSYPGTSTPVLDHVSLDIRRGEFVAFCGESGGGKSTLVLALMGMLQPQEGRIECDGKDIFSMVRSWHRNIGYVSQQIFIANRTVRDNVAFGHGGPVTDERVWQALEMAAAAEFVRALPEGLDTMLKDGGTNLSGGQRQRIVVARALYKDPEVLFLDEATAALDNITEQDISTSIQALSQYKTIVVVAHRLTTIKGADRIYLLNGGRITAEGDYATLLRESRDFQNLAQGLRARDSAS